MVMESMDKHGNTDFHNPAFLTSMCQNASFFAILQNWILCTSRRKVAQANFFSSQVVRLRSIGSVVAIDPLVDSIPEPSIDGYASAVLHSTGTNFFQVIPTTINLLGSCNFHLSPHSV